jgi:transposase-like protein
MAKKGQTYKRYSPEFKLSVIMDMRENHLSYDATARKYFGNSENFHKTVIRWERIYLEEGPEGLAIERRGRASKMSGVKKGRPRKIKTEVQDDLIAENQRLKERLEYLEAENEYLKKLDALIREKEARAAARKKK